MAIEKQKKITGKWYVSENGLSLPGVLIIDSSNSSQLLKLYSKTDFNGNSLSDMATNPVIEYLTMCGECRMPDYITLNDCKYSGAISLGEGLYEIHYKPKYSFESAMFFNHDETMIKELTCTFPYFSSWYDTNRIFFGDICSSINEMEPSIVGDDLINEINLDDEISIQIVRKYTNNSTVFQKKATSEITHYVCFRSSLSKSIKDFKALAEKFMQLIEFTTGKLVYVNYISIIAEIESTYKYSEKLSCSNKFIYSRMRHYNSIYKRELSSSDFLNHSQMLFFGGQGRFDNVNQVIKSWYTTYEQYSSVYNIYLDTLEWFQNTNAELSQIMFNNRVLNLIQALESYHSFTYDTNSGEDMNHILEKARQILCSINNISDKDWILERIKPLHITLKTRLCDLYLKRFRNISGLMFRDEKEINGFVRIIIDIRNKLSHGEKVHIETAKIATYYYRCLLLLVCCILKNLEFSNTEIENIFRNNQRIVPMINFIQSSRG